MPPTAARMRLRERCVGPGPSMARIVIAACASDCGGRSRRGELRRRDLATGRFITCRNWCDLLVVRLQDRTRNGTGRAGRRATSRGVYFTAGVLVVGQGVGDRGGALVQDPVLREPAVVDTRGGGIGADHRFRRIPGRDVRSADQPGGEEGGTIAGTDGRAGDDLFETGDIADDLRPQSAPGAAADRHDPPDVGSRPRASSRRCAGHRRRWPPAPPASGRPGCDPASGPRSRPGHRGP